MALACSLRVERAANVPERVTFGTLALRQTETPCKPRTAAPAALECSSPLELWLTRLAARLWNGNGVGLERSEGTRVES